MWHIQTDMQTHRCGSQPAVRSATALAAHSVRIIWVNDDAHRASDTRCLLPLPSSPAAEITSRPSPALGNYDLLPNSTAVVEYVCPPGTFIRSWDGRADAAGLYALGITCSDGTFAGSLGTWGSAEEFVETTPNDGYTTITAREDANGAVIGVMFRDR